MVAVFESLPQISSISVALSHYCYLLEGNVLCEGFNEYGQLDVPSFGVVTLLSVGRNHSCALDDHEMKCWGSNSYGQTNVPTDLPNIQLMATGERNTCVVVNDQFSCWGDNSQGQLTSTPTYLNNVESMGAGAAHMCAE